MITPQWAEVDEYLAGLLLPEAASLDWILAENKKAGLPEIDVSAAFGKLLALLIRISGASRILEVGTLGGYSTAWMAQALPKAGRIVTLELESSHARIAEANFEKAGVDHLIEIQVGPAEESLRALAEQHVTPFDFVFIDADKESNPTYFKQSLHLTRPGSVILIDNVIRDGQVADTTTVDPKVIGVRRMNEIMAATPNISATAIQTVGKKGYDGFALISVLR